MGASESIQVAEEDDDEETEQVEQNIHDDSRRRLLVEDNLMKKVVEQEPEQLPCHASASPLSPQPSSFGTPRLPPSIKEWDPCNVLSPPPQFTRSFSDMVDEDRATTEVYMICQAECLVNLRPDLVGGRCPESELTVNRKRQARALAVFLKSQGIRFNAVYTSPLKFRLGMCS
ncbi:putative histidine phosphatase superfamily [Helianthus debilis subsp. tardiflorus]